MTDEAREPTGLRLLSAAEGPTRHELRRYRICRFIAVGISKILFPGPVVGTERLPSEGAYVVAPIHRSNLDWLIVARISHRRLRFLAKAEIWKHERLGRFIETLGAMPVQRSTADRASFERCLAALRGGEPLVVFPEGTRNSGDELGPTHEGAAYLALRAGVPLVPVGLAGTERALGKGQHLPRFTRVRIVIGEPLLGAVGDSRTKVPRSLLRTLSEELRDAIQRASDNAQALLRLEQGDRLGSSPDVPIEPPPPAPGE